MTIESCATCRFFRDVSTNLPLKPFGTVSGECRFFPPVADTGGYPHLPKPARRPKVDADEWCGQYARGETA